MAYTRSSLDVPVCKRLGHKKTPNYHNLFGIEVKLDKDSPLYKEHAHRIIKARGRKRVKLLTHWIYQEDMNETVSNDDLLTPRRTEN